MNKIIILMALSLLFFSSCKKNKNCGKTMNEIAGSYKIMKYDYGGAEEGIMGPCEIRLIYTFNVNGNAVINDPDGVCPGTLDALWGITNGKFWLKNTGGWAHTVDTAEIVSFDCSTLALGATQSSSERITFKRN